MELENKEVMQQSLIPEELKDIISHIIRLKGYSELNKEKDPEKAYKEAKKPIDKNWTKQGITEEEAREWIEKGGWIGAVLKEGYILVDIDDKKTGETIKNFLQKQKLVFACVDTPRGNQFIFKDAGFVKKGTAGVYVVGGFEVDYRLPKTNCFVLPTKNTEDRKWTIYPEDPEQISPMPEIFIPIHTYATLVKKKKKRGEVEDILLPLTIPEGTRDNTLTSHAGRIREYLRLYRPDIQVEKVLLPILKQVNLAFCRPPLEDEQVEKIVKSVLRPEYVNQTEAGGSKQASSPKDMVLDDGEEAEELRELFGLDYTPKLSDGFAIQDGVLYKVIEKRTETKLIPLSPAFIVSERILTDTELFLNLRATNGETRIIKASFEDKKEFENSMNTFFRLPFTSEQLKGLREYIAKFLWFNNENIPTIHGLSRTGWIDVKFYIPSLQADGVVWINKKLEESIRVSDYGSLEEEEKFLRRMVRTYAGIPTLASLSAPALALFDLPNYVLAVTGLTGTGKTTSVKYGMSLWGDPEALLQTWYGTKAGREGIVETYKDLPVWFEEMETIGKQVEEVVDFIYQFTTGKGKTRRKKDLSLKKEAEFRGVLLTTSEKSLNSIISYVGSKRNKPYGVLRRVLEVKANDDFFKDFETGEEIKPEEIHRHVSKNFGRFGVKWAKFLNEVATKEDLMNEAKEKVRELIDSFPIFNGLQYAYASMGFALWGLYKLGIISKEDYDLVFEKLKQHAEETNREFKAKVDLVEEFITVLKDFYAINSKCFEEEENDVENALKDRIYGRKIGNDLAILPTKFYEICKEYGFDKDQVLQALDKAGKLKREGNRRQVSVRIAKIPHRVYWIRDILANVGGQEQEQNKNLQDQNNLNEALEQELKERDILEKIENYEGTEIRLKPEELLNLALHVANQNGKENYDADKLVDWLVKEFPSMFRKDGEYVVFENSTGWVGKELLKTLRMLKDYLLKKAEVGGDDLTVYDF